jgi:hypothetical protein
MLIVQYMRYTCSECSQQTCVLLSETYEINLPSSGWIQIVRMYCKLLSKSHFIFHAEWRHNVCPPAFITLRSWVLLGKPAVTRQLKKFPAFYRTQKFTTRWQETVTGPYPEPDESSPHPTTHFSKIYCIISSHLLLELSSDHFLYVFLPKFCMQSTCVLHVSSPWFNHSNNIWPGLQVVKLLIMQFSLKPRIILSLFGPNVLKRSWSVFSSQCERHKFHTHTEVQGKSQFCIF